MKKRNQQIRRLCSSLLAFAMVFTTAFSSGGLVVQAEETAEEFLEVSVPNGDFESGQEAWTFTGLGTSDAEPQYWRIFVNQWASNNLTNWYEAYSHSGTAETYTLSQTVAGLVPGTYKASVEGAGGNDGGSLTATLTAGGQSVAITPTKWDTWATYTTEPFTVDESGTCDIAISITVDMEYINLDNVKLWRLDDGQEEAKAVDSVQEISEKVAIGNTFTAPALATVLYEDGTSDYQEVTWNETELAAVSTAAAATFTVNGTVTVGGKNYNVVMTVEVLDVSQLTQHVEEDATGSIDFNENWQFYLATRTPALAETPSSSKSNGAYFAAYGLADAGDYTTEEIVATDFNDLDWRTVDVPHDYSIEGEKTSASVNSQGYLQGGLGYYRKKFTVPASMEGNRTISIDFEGVYQDSIVYLNGEEVGSYPSGYTGFALDITDKVLYGEENVLVVKVQNMSPSGRWYTGSGITRPVHLVIDELTHFNRNGITLTTPTLADDYTADQSAKLTVEAEGFSDASASNVRMTVGVYDADGKLVAEGSTAETAVEPSTAFALSLSDIEVKNVNLWYPWNLGTPYVYTVKADLYAQAAGSTDDYQLVDTEEITYGFRWVEVQETTEDPTTGGLYINGEYTKVQGVDLHHDSGSLGAVSYTDAYEHQFSKLMSMGVNAYRTSHCPPSKQVIEVCTRNGIMVVEEAFDGWGSAKATYDFSNFFFIEVPEDWAGLKPNGYTALPAPATNYEGAKLTWSDWVIQEMVNRDKNEASVIAWSIGNEIRGTGTKPSWYDLTQYDPLGVGPTAINEYTEAARLLKNVDAADGTRYVVMGGDQQRSVPKATDVWGYVNQLLDGYGLNYNTAASVDGLISRFTIGDGTLLEGGTPAFFFESESSSQTSSRGVYLDPQFSNTGVNQTPGSRGGSNYDNDFASWTMSNEYGLKKDRDRKSFIGQFIWSGFDYIGEPTPYSVYPVGVSSFGTIDTAGFPKDSFYLYQSQWTTDPMVHLLPSNWDQWREGETVEVWVNTNLQSAELFLNGESLGVKSFDEKETAYGKTYYETSEKTTDDKTWGDTENPGGYSSPGAVLDEGELNSGKLHLTWEVPYEPGTLEVKAYDAGGNVAATDSVTTSSVPYTIVAEADKTVLAADGTSLSYVECTVVDENGNMVPDADNLVRFSVSGAVSIVGVDNGQQESDELYKYGNTDSSNYSERSAYNGKVLVILKSEKEAGDAVLTISSDDLKPVQVSLKVTEDGTGTAAADPVVTGTEVSVDPVEITVPTGVEVELPAVVRVHYTSNAGNYSVLRKVTWGELTNGSAEGTIEGSALKASAAVTEDSKADANVELATGAAEATASFTGSTKNYPANMVDGNEATTWTNAYTRSASVLLPANSASRAYDYVEFSWAEAQVLNQIALTFTENAGKAVPSLLEAQYWNGAEWTAVSEQATETSDLTVTMQFAPVYAEKVRVYMENATPFSTTGNIEVTEASVMLRVERALGDITQNVEEDAIGSIDFNENWQFYLATRTPALAETPSSSKSNGAYFAAYGLADAGDYTTDEIIDPNFNDLEWRTVDVPHDFSIEGEKTSASVDSQAYLQGGLGYYRKRFTVPASMQGNKTISIDFEGVYQDSVVYLNGEEVGSYPSGYTGFALDITDKLKYGEENVLVVKVQNMSPSGRWYTGSGITRPVHLVIDNLAHFNRNGITLTSPSLETVYGKNGSAYLAVEAKGYSDASNANVRMEVGVYDAEGNRVAGGSTEDIAINPSTAFTLTLEGSDVIVVPNVNLWYPWNLGTPYLYTVKTDLYLQDNGGEGEWVLTDSEETSYGFRWVEVQETTEDPNSGGLYVNGEYTKIQGVDLHHDSGSLGAVSYTDAYEHQFSKLISMGVNAYRTSHCPPSKQVIEVCARNGIMVVEEAFDGWGTAKATYDFSNFFFIEVPEDWAGLKPNGYTKLPAPATNYEGAKLTWSDWVIQEMVNRDKNEACVIAWSIGNEIRGVGTAPSWYDVTQYDPLGANPTKINEYTEAARLLNNVDAADGTRYVVMGGDQQRSVPTATSTWGLVNQLLDGYGLNYNTAISVDGLINRFSIGDGTLLETGTSAFFFESESSSQTSSRGVYLDPQFGNTGINQTPGSRGGSNYDNDFASWTMSNEYGLKKDRDRKSFIGQFIWSGFDYLGEPTPYSVYPVGVSSFGTIDTAGFPKDSFYLYQSQWTTDPMVHLLPTNWDQWREGENVEVWVNTNQQSAELFLNGESLGVKSFDEKETAYGKTYYETSEKTTDDKTWGDAENPGGYSSPGAVLDEGELNSGKLHLTWEVPYEPGTLEVKAYNADGTVVAVDSVTTSSTPYTIQAEADKTVLAADGTSLSYVECTVVDENGNMVPDADNLVKFSVSGAVTIVGVDNGQQESAELYKYGNTDSSDYSERSAYNGKVLVILKSEKEAGDAVLTISSDDLKPTQVSLKVTEDGTGTAAADPVVTGTEVSVDPVAISVPEGTAEVALPAVVRVHYTSNAGDYSVLRSVTWGELTNGSAEGTIEGSALKASAKVSVNAQLNTDVELATGLAEATASFTGSTKNYPANMVDGDTTTTWTNAYTRSASVLLPANSASRAYDYVEFSWAEAQVLNQIALSFTENPGKAVPALVEAQYWNGTEWTKVSNQVTAAVDTTVTMQFAPVYAEKVRVYMENATPFSTTGNIEIAEASVKLSTEDLGIQAVIADAEVTQGAKLTSTVQLSNLPADNAITEISFVPVYDTEAFEELAVALADGVSGTLTSSEEDGKIVYTYTNADGIPADLTDFAVITLRAKLDAAPGSYSLALADLAAKNANEESVSINAGAATITLAERQITGEVTYLSDLEWVSAVSGWESVEIDKYCNGASSGTISLNVGGTKTVFEKGLGANADSEIIYDLSSISAALEEKETLYFQTYVGIDYFKVESGASGKGDGMYFIVYGTKDGVETELYKSELLSIDSEAERISLDITGVTQLRLVMDKNISNSHDNGDWADAKLILVPDPDAADKTELKAALDSASSLVAEDYTVESYKVLAEAIASAEEVYANKKATQDEVDEQTANLTAAIENLKVPDASDYQELLKLLAEKETALTNLQNQLEEALLSLVDKENELTDTLTELTEAQAQLTEKTVELTALAAELEAKAGELAEVQAQLEEKDQLLAAKEEQLLQFQADLTKIVALLDTAEEKVDTLTENLDTANSKIAELENSAAANEREIQLWNDRVSDLQTQLEAANSNTTQLTSDLAVAQNNVTRLEAEKTSLANELQIWEERAEGLEAQIATANNNVTQLTSDLAVAQNNVTALEEEKATLTSEKSALESEKTALERENAALESEKTTLENAITSLNSAVGTLESQISSLNDEITALKVSAAETQTKLTAAEQAKTTLEAQLEAANQAADDARQEANNAKEDADNARQEAEDAKKAAEEAAAELAAAQKAAEDAAAELAAAQKAAEDAAATQAEAAEALQAAQKELEQAKAEAANAAPTVTIQKGDTVVVSNVAYRVTNAELKQAAAFSTTKSTATSIKVADTVVINGVTCTVTSIAASAFKSMSKLKKVVIGKNVTTIGKKAFYSDKNLKTIQVKATGLKKVGKLSLKNIAANAVIKVPASKKAAYTKLFKNKGQKTTVKIK